MDFKIEEQNKPEDYLIPEKYRNMINAKKNYSSNEFKIGKKELENLLKNYSEKEEYIKIKNRFNEWIKKFDDIIKEKTLAKILVRKAFNKLKE